MSTPSAARLTSMYHHPRRQDNRWVEIICCVIAPPLEE